MRDVSALDPARFAPDAIVLKLPAWRPLPDGAGEVFDEGARTWSRIHPIVRAALESLADGDGFERTNERALAVAGDIKPNHVRLLLRRYLWQLHRGGHVRIPFEEAPALFAGRYERIGELGRGGAGIAHRCRDRESGREVVVKHAWGYLSPIDRADRVVRRETAVLQRLSHPGIVAFVDAFEERGLHHLVRELAEGDPLPAIVARGAVPRERRITVARACAAALAHVHERGFLLLDLTPANFVVRPTGEPILMDVGVCREHVDGAVALPGSTGSRGYAAPEVMAEHRATLRSDVYSFGASYQMLLTRAAPAHRATRAQREAALAKAGAPEDEATFVLACCEAREEDRPADARALDAWLTRLAASS